MYLYSYSLYKIQVTIFTQLRTYAYQYVSMYFSLQITQLQSGPACACKKFTLFVQTFVNTRQCTRRIEYMQNKMKNPGIVQQILYFLT